MQKINPGFGLKMCFLLTACIDPKGCYGLMRRDPRTRQKDYIHALRTWLRRNDLPIIFCENSGYDPSKIKQSVKKDRKKGREIEVLQFQGNDYPRLRSKG